MPGPVYDRLGDSEGYLFYDPTRNQVIPMARPEVNDLDVQVGIRPATPEEIEGARRGLAAGSTGQKALAAGEAALSGATLGLFEGDPARQQVLQQENPITAGFSTTLGTLGPALLTGAGAGAAAARLGVGRAGVGVATLAGEEFGQALAQEGADAAAQDRNVEVGNLFQNLAVNAAFLGGARLISRVNRGAKAAGESLEAAAESPASALAHARTRAKATRQELSGTPSRAEATHYARNQDEIHAELNDLAGDSGDSLFGREGSFQAAHSVHLKKTDIAGRMTDADVAKVDGTAKDFEERLRVLAEDIANPAAAGMASPAAKRVILQHADDIAETYARSVDAEDLAIALDRTKRTLDGLRERFGAVQTKAGDPLRKNVQLIDDVVEPLRRNLEDVPTWGKHWAEKQAGENRLWSGRQGIIENRAIWQAKLTERLPGAAGRERNEWGSIPVFRVKGDLTEQLLKLNTRDRRHVLDAFDADMAATDAMTQLKLAAAQGEPRKAILRARQDLDNLRTAVEEAKRVVQLHEIHGKTIDAIRQGGDSVGEAIAQGAGAVTGGALGGIPGAIAGGIIGRQARKIYAERFAPVGKASERLSREQLLTRVAERRELRASGKFPKHMTGRMATAVEGAEKALKALPQSAKEQGLESLLATGTAAGGLAMVASASEALDELDRTGKQLREHSVMSMVTGRVKPLENRPSISARFRGEADSLERAFEEKSAKLLELAGDPEQFVARMTEAYGGLSRSGHAGLAAQLSMRTRTAVDYLIEHLPPSVARSMFSPSGGTPDRIAIMQFASLWEGVWFPLDVVRDLAGRKANPTQLRAVRDVHPELYSSIVLDVLKTVGEAGKNVPFEARRYLDVMLNLGSAAGPSFSQNMTNLLALARQSNRQTPQSLGGESVVAPATPTDAFRKGPSAIQPT